MSGDEREFEWIDDPAADDEDDFDCGGMVDGTCMYAGTEWCDFECPYRD
jgi:hypothetical protein